MGAQGRTFVETNKGALEKLLGLVVPLIDGSAPSPVTARAVT
jgi:hypothetical protein